MKKNVEIKRLDHQGRGIGYVDNKIIFIPNSLPDENVTCSITLEKKKYLEGKVVEYLNYSKNRVEAICPYYSVCGGCNIMHLSLKNQLKYKKEKVEDILGKYASIEKNFIKDIISSNEFFYRNKLTLKVNKNVGLYEKSSNNIVLIDKCFISNDKINSIICKINELDLSCVKQVVIRYSEFSDEIMVIFEGNLNNQNIDILLNDVVSVIEIDGKDIRCLFGKDHLIEKLGDFKFIISPLSFFQVNTKQAEKLYFKVVEYCNLKKTDVVLDLYCGTGTIGLFLSPYCKNVVGIEINKSATRDAKENAVLNKVDNIKFYAGDVGDTLRNINIKPNVIVVDPPRAGLDETARNIILSLNPEKIVYVSCDPMTLARDLKIFMDKYVIVEVTPVDMFPNTAHVECVCVLNRQ